MDLNAVLKALEAQGTAQNRLVYQRYGVTPPLYGVSYANLKALRKSIKTDHHLAVELWATGNHDARILACMVADPGTLSVTQLNQWVRALSNYVLTDAFAALAAASPHGEGRFVIWVKSRNEWISSAAWGILANLALDESDRPDAFFRPWIMRIQAAIHDAPNRTRHAMNNALIAIGVRNDALARIATKAAAAIGPIVVDHGKTNCKTPDAAVYIQKTRDHYKKGS